MNLGIPYLPARWQIDTPDRADRLDVFPLLPGRGFLTQKSPEWSTRVATAVSGRERRAQYWSAPRWRFKVDHEFLRTWSPPEDELARIVEFFCDHAGQARQFYFYDQTDNLVENQKIGEGDGVTTKFQLRRSVRRWSEPVYAIAGGFHIYVNYVEAAANVLTNGVVEFATAPAAGRIITWSGRFMFLCRFDADQIDLAQDFSDVWSLADMTFYSIKP